MVALSAEQTSATPMTMFGAMYGIHLCMCTHRHDILISLLITGTAEQIESTALEREVNTQTNVSIDVYLPSMH